MIKICIDGFPKKFYPEPVGDDLKPNRSLRAFCRPLFAVSFLTALLYVLQPGPLLSADGEADSAKLGSLNKKVVELYQAGKLNEAIPIAQEALELTEKARGPDHTDTAEALNNLALVYYSAGDYAKAEPLYQRALKIDEKALGPNHPGTATVLNNLAGLYQSTSDYAKAEPLYQRALKIDEKALGPEHPDTASTLNNLAELYRSTGDYAKAEPLYQRALKIDEKALGPNHPGTATVLNNLALLYRSTGDYTKAEPLFQRALQITEKAIGPYHPDTAKALGNLAQLYRVTGDYAKAEPLLQRALQITEKAIGPNHPATAIGLNNLAGLYQSAGDYAKAEPLYQRALKIDEKALGPDHPDTATTLNNLARLYRSRGDYAKAEPLYQRALKIDEKALGPDHPDTATTLNNLALLYQSTGDYAKAEPLLQRALKIAEKALGPDHPDTATYLNNLALLYNSTGDYAKAEPLYQRALKIDEEALGPNHPTTARAINNLALLYHSTSDYAKAEPLYQRALKIDEKALGQDHPEIATDLNNLAYLKIGLGEAKEAIPLAEKARQAQEKYLSNILSFTSERQRLEFQKTTDPYSLPGTLGRGAELAQTVLRQKGVVLDSLLEDRLVAEASSDPKQREIIDQLRAAKQGLMQLVLEVPKDLSQAAQKQRAAEKGKLSTEVEQLEGGLARQGKARRALSVTVPEVQSVLPKQAVLIELLRYSHYLGKGKFEPRYGAVVISASGEPKWVPLGVAADMEKSIELYQRSARGKTDDATLDTVLKALAERVWAPIEKSLPTDTKTIIISPDGALSFVSFATLVGPDDKFLGERYSIRYAAAGRDLLRESKPSANPATIVFANPDFEDQTVSRSTASPSAVALRSLEMRDLQNIPLIPLPGTKEEANVLEKQAGKAVKIFLGADATEAELRRVNSPRILHLATHGFFLPEIELGRQANSVLQQASEAPKLKLKNPMYRSGLALAGAQSTLQAWGRGEPPPIENDGIVTAEEVGGLKLNGTWLVVLSACETGLGEARAGEGVMGLRRGFIQAGTQNLLLTLWPISDKAAAQIMPDFYDASNRIHNAPDALAEVQRKWLVKLRKDRGLRDAVNWAGPFIMSSQGKP